MKYMGKATDSYVWEAEILAATKLSKTCAADRAGNIVLLMLYIVLDFKVEYS